MMLAKFIYRRSPVLAACCLLVLSACATNEALDQQLANSREAVDQAQIAGAEQTATSDYYAAVNKLNRANAAAENRNKDEAMRLAQEAQVDANLARAQTDSAQARIAATELAKSNRILRGIKRANNNQQR